MFAVRVRAVVVNEVSVHQLQSKTISCFPASLCELLYSSLSADMAPKMMPAARRAEARYRLAQYHNRPRGFASDRVLTQARATVRRNRGHVEPPLVRKLRLGEAWTINDINAPVHVQDETMGRLLRAELPSWYFKRIIDAFEQINERQRLLALPGQDRVLVIAPHNVIFNAAE